ncbi:MAG: hypothetical protein LV480_04630 [Methylacidiphilales bacterium]|nr:hypothetical protein [Candidatus Methylacidiphilales bacterium]
MLPQLAGVILLLASQFFLPQSSIPRLVVEVLAVIYFAVYLIWYMRHGYALAHELGRQMNIENQVESLGARWRSVEDRLDELERLKRRDMVTPEEYTAKRQEILKDL